MYECRMVSGAARCRDTVPPLQKPLKRVALNSFLGRPVLFFFVSPRFGVPSRNAATSMPPSLTYRTAGMVLRVVLCCTLGAVCAHCTVRAATVTSAAAPDTSRQELHPQRLATGWSETCPGPAPRRSVAGAVVSPASSYLVTTNAFHRTLSCGNTLASAVGSRATLAVYLRHFASRLRRCTTLLHPRGRPAAGVARNPLTTCRLPHDVTPLLGFRPPSRPAFAVGKTNYLLGSRRLFRNHQPHPSAIVDSYDSAAGLLSPATLSYPSAASFRIGRAPESPNGAAAATGPSTSSSCVRNCPLAAPARTSAAAHKLHPPSMSCGTATCTALRRPATVSAEVAPLTKERSAAASLSQDTIFPESTDITGAAAPVQVLLPLHVGSIEGSFMSSSTRLCGAAGLSLAKPSSAPARPQRAANHPVPHSDRATLPATRQGAAAAAATTSAASAMVCGLALPGYATVNLLGRLKSFKRLPPSSSLLAAAFLPVAFPSLTAAAASCLLYFLTGASAARGGGFSPPLPASLSGCSAPLAPDSALTRLRPAAPRRSRAAAVQEILAMSGTASAASPSVPYTSSSAVDGASEEQQCVTPKMKLKDGDGYNGEGLHYFPPSLSQQQRHTSTVEGDAKEGAHQQPVAGADLAAGAASSSLPEEGPSSGAAAHTETCPSGLYTGDDKRGEQEQKQKPATLIFLHGLGDSAEGWKDVVPLALSAFSDAASFLRIILPTAPVRPVTLTGGMPTRAWADVMGLTKDTPEDEDGFRASKERLDAIINGEVQAGVLPSRIMIAGFSQGGALAYHVGLQSQFRLAGIAALSTWLPLPLLLKLSPACTLPPSDSSSSRSSGGYDSAITSGGTEVRQDPLPVLHCHGIEDELVDFNYGSESVAHLRQLYIQAGVPPAAAEKAIQFNGYEGLGHTANTPMLADFRAFMIQCLQQR